MLPKWVGSVGVISYGSGTLAKRYLFSCLHLFMSSLRLFKRIFLFLNMRISSFSAVHRLQSLFI